MSDSFRDWSDAGREHLLEIARSQGVLSALDQQFASRLAALYEQGTPGMRWALALASRQESAGHVCADLRRLESEGLSVEVAGAPATFSLLATHDSLDGWIDEMKHSSLVEAHSNDVDERGAARPLVLDESDRL